MKNTGDFLSRTPPLSKWMTTLLTIELKICWCIEVRSDRFDNLILFSHRFPLQRTLQELIFRRIY
jgi:hypothetical protein